MNKFPSNRAWMYDRCYRGKGALKEAFILGVEEFITKTCQRECYQNDRGYDVHVVSVIVQ